MSPIWAVTIFVLVQSLSPAGDAFLQELERYERLSVKGTERQHVGRCMKLLQAKACDFFPARTACNGTDHPGSSHFAKADLLWEVDELSGPSSELEPQTSLSHRHEGSQGQNSRNLHATIPKTTPASGSHKHLECLMNFSGQRDLSKLSVIKYGNIKAQKSGCCLKDCCQAIGYILASQVKWKKDLLIPGSQQG